MVDAHLEVPQVPPASIWKDRPKRQLIPKNRLLSEERLRTLFPSNLDRGEGTCLESAVNLLIQRPS